MECGGDWEHLALLGCVQMNDGTGVFSCGLDREVWEGEPPTQKSLSLIGGGLLRPCALFFWVHLLFLCTCVCLTVS